MRFSAMPVSPLGSFFPHQDMALDYYPAKIVLSLRSFENRNADLAFYYSLRGQIVCYPVSRYSRSVR